MTESHERIQHAVLRIPRHVTQTGIKTARQRLPFEQPYSALPERTGIPQQVPTLVDQCRCRPPGVASLVGVCLCLHSLGERSCRGGAGSGAVPWQLELLQWCPEATGGIRAPLCQAISVWHKNQWHELTLLVRVQC